MPTIDQFLDLEASLYVDRPAPSDVIELTGPSDTTIRWDVVVQGARLADIIVEPGRSLPRVTGEGWLTLALAVEGCLAVFGCDSVEGEFLPGEAIVLPADPSTRVVADRWSRVVMVAAPVARLRARCNVPLRLTPRKLGIALDPSPSFQHLARLGRNGRAIAAALGEPAYPPFEQGVETTIHALLADLLAQHGIGGRSVMCGYTRRALAFMRDHVEAPTDLKALARAAGCSARCLHLAFARDLGAPPLAVFRNLKLDRAREILAQRGVRNVAELARRLGFGNCGRFAHYFKERFGTFPSDLLRGSQS
jgi:AraC-like DNA-binding protein